MAEKDFREVRQRIFNAENGGKLSNIDKPTIHFYSTYWKDELCWGEKNPKQLLVISKT